MDLPKLGDTAKAVNEHFASKVKASFVAGLGASFLFALLADMHVLTLSNLTSNLGVTFAGALAGYLKGE